MIETILGIIGFILTFPLKASLRALEAQLVAIKTVEVAERTSTVMVAGVNKVMGGTSKILKQSPIGSMVLGNTKSGRSFVSAEAQCAVQMSQKAVQVTRKMAQKAIETTIAYLRVLIALINTIITFFQCFSITGLIIVVTVGVILLVSAVAASTAITTNMQGSTVTIGGESSEVIGENRGESESLEDWIEVCDELAQWYTQNINTYMGGVGARKAYTCPLLTKADGSSWKVYDDCSSYVVACFQLAGWYDENGTIYRSGDFLVGGSAEYLLKEAGFKMIGSGTELKGKLQKGDIIVYDGHIEVFSNYSENGKVMSWTWGAVYKTLPAVKGGDETSYTNVWRLY